MPSSRQRPILFSAARRTERETTSAADFMSTLEPRPVRPWDLAGWNTSIPMTKSAAWLTGCDACSPEKPTNPNIGYVTPMANIAGFAPVPSLFEIPMGISSSGTEPVPTFTTASFSSNRFAITPSNWREWSISGPLSFRRLSSRLMTMQDEERRRIAREIHDGLGQELAAAKMILDGIHVQGPFADNSPGVRGCQRISRSCDQASANHFSSSPSAATR